MKVKKCIAITGLLGLSFSLNAEKQDSLTSNVERVTSTEIQFKPDLKLIRLEPINGITQKDSLQKITLPPVPLGFFCKFEDIMQQKWKIPLNLELK